MTETAAPLLSSPRRAIPMLGIAFTVLLILKGLIGFTAINYALVAVVLAIYVVVARAVAESAVGLIGLTLIAFWVLMAVAAPILPLPDPNAGSTAFLEQLAPVQKAASMVQVMTGAFAKAGKEYVPTPEQLSALSASTSYGIEHEGVTHWLSVDLKGRDMLSRIIWGSQRVLLWASIATIVAYIVGMLFGVAAGYLGGWTDEIISFFANVMLAFPVMVLYVVIINALREANPDDSAILSALGVDKNALRGLIIVVAVTFASAPGIMRIVRGLALDIKTRDYIAAAETRGEPAWRIMIVELLPNARGPLIVDACLRLGYTTIALATLGFLGLGLPPPDPDWGSQLVEGKDGAQFFPHLVLYPAVALSSLILGFNMLADGLRDISLRD